MKDQKSFWLVHPKNKSDQAKLSIHKIKPGPRSTIERCSQCGIKVWIGPKQRETRIQHNHKIKCFICLKEQSGGAIRNIINLGGFGSDITFD